jgi:tRNA(fMet)-specific endonuclease VapC
VSVLVDTNICIAWLKGDKRVRDAWLELDPDELGLSSVVRAELLSGARHSKQVAANLRRLDVLFGAMRSVPFDAAAAGHYGLVRAQLASQGRPIGPNDLMIAATALAHDATLVTRNETEFSRVVGLRVVAW